MAKAKVNTFSVDPYARWSYAKFGPVRLFLDMGFGVAASKYKGEVAGHEVDSDALVAWRIGVAPGIAVSLCKNLDFIAHCGFLGYRESDGVNSAYGETGFGFELSGNDLSFGVVYNF